MAATEHSDRMGHEFLGVVEDTGADVPTLKRGDVVAAPFVWADNTCDFCQAGLQTSCRHGGHWGAGEADVGVENWSKIRLRAPTAHHPRWRAAGCGMRGPTWTERTTCSLRPNVKAFGATSGPWSRGPIADIDALAVVIHDARAARRAVSSARLMLPEISASAGINPQT